MAEKKFFVDINLQGSALTNAKIGTNSGIGSTEGAFGYDSASHRLQYFNGTATKDVANLSDIAAVTGGLIFQGGYDPTTDTPDITDGTALKGFFWAATAAGTFLGEAVQVGDSIVAKADAAGTTLSDWLILQGNVVIATDSVDGISRLATQAEANDGTEAGAVVITPATLQGKIDAQITPEISSKLPLAGGTMSGALNMSGNAISDISSLNVQDTVYTDAIESNAAYEININSNLDFNNATSLINLPAPTNGGDAANKTYVDDNTSNKLPLAGGTMSGDINMNSNSINNATGVTAVDIYTNGIQSIEPGNDVYLFSNINANNNKITNLQTPTNGTDAANKNYVDGVGALKLDLAGGTMSGAINMGSYPINNIETPSFDTDAANKLYVDNTASTAESNANAYTDARSTAEFVATGDWVDGGGFYYAEVAHGISGNVMITLLYNDRPAEFDFEQLGGSITLYSNILPTATTQVNVMKVS